METNAITISIAAPRDGSNGSALTLQDLECSKRQESSGRKAWNGTPGPANGFFPLLCWMGYEYDEVRVLRSSRGTPLMPVSGFLFVSLGR